MKTRYLLKGLITLVFLAIPAWAQPVLDKSSDLFPNWADPFISRLDAETMKYGYPGTDQLIFRKGYVLSYDAKHRQAHWVCERLNRLSLEGPGVRRDNFQEDPSIDPEHRSRPKDYSGSGYDQGHLSPAEDNVATQAQMDESFFMTNMSPQIGIKFNRHYWANLEKTVRDWAREPQVENLFVVTGPVYKQLNEQSVPGKTFLTYQVIGQDNVAVPTHYFKVMLAEMKNGEVRTLALLLPHRGIANTEPLSEFLTSIDEVETVSGLDFFNRLPDNLESSQEKVKPQTVWTLGGP